jgi:hypothetical protein
MGNNDLMQQYIDSAALSVGLVDQFLARSPGITGVALG